MVELDYADATYDDGGTGLGRDLVFKTVFVDDEPGFNASVMEELNALESEVDLPVSVRVTEVRVQEVDDSTVDLIVRCPDLTVGTQTTRGQHSRLVLRDGAYNHYRVGVEAG